ncbi:MAG: hypothetical protein IJ412_01815 [Oscillospiraceae bacterium]|nr:hypothetical protein [Oscillospiraceae bacterium]
MKKRNKCCPLKGVCRIFGAKRWLLPAALYVLVWVCALCVAAVTLAADTTSRRSGALAAAELTLADFTLINAHTESDTLLVSDNEDPQMIYTPAAGKMIQSLTLRLEYDRYPYERCLYYVTAEGEPFGQDKRVWPVENADGTVSFTLPRGVKSIRLDPGSCTDLHMEFSSIEVNRPQSAAAYFIPDGGSAFALLVLPGLGAAALQWCADTARDFRRKEEKDT